MKKYLVALLFGISLMSMQTASAATLSLAKLFGTGSVTTGSGSTVLGSGSGGTFWEVTLSGLGAGFVADLDLSSTVIGPTTSFSSGFLGTSGQGLSNGTYALGIVLSPLTSSFNFEVAINNIQNIGGNNVPVPAAAWLFGSALMGLMGITRRKSKPVLAA